MATVGAGRSGFEGVVDPATRRALLDLRRVVDRLIGSLAVGSTATTYVFRGTTIDADPGDGGMFSSGVGVNPRRVSLSKSDSDGTVRDLGVLKGGDGLFVCNYPNPPVTAWARYLLLAPPFDRGTYWFLDGIERTDFSGSVAPPVGTSLQVAMNLSG